MSETFREQTPETEILPLNPELLDQLSSLHQQAANLDIPTPDQLLQGQSILRNVDGISGLAEDQAEAIQVLKDYYDDSTWTLNNDERTICLALSEGGGVDAIKGYSNELAKRIIEVVAKQTKGSHTDEFHKVTVTKPPKEKPKVEHSGAIVDASNFLAQEASKLIQLDRYISDKHFEDKRSRTDSLRQKREELIAQKKFTSAYEAVVNDPSNKDLDSDELEARAQGAGSAAREAYLTEREKIFSEENGSTPLRNRSSARQDEVSPEGVLQIQTSAKRFRGLESDEGMTEVSSLHRKKLQDTTEDIKVAEKELEDLQTELKKDPRSGLSAFSKPVKWYKVGVPDYPGRTPEMMSADIESVKQLLSDLRRQRDELLAERSDYNEQLRYGRISQLLVEKLRIKLEDESKPSVEVGSELKPVSENDELLDMTLDQKLDAIDSDDFIKTLQLEFGSKFSKLIKTEKEVQGLSDREALDPESMLAIQNKVLEILGNQVANKYSSKESDSDTWEAIRTAVIDSYQKYQERQAQKAQAQREYYETMEKAGIHNA